MAEFGGGRYRSSIVASRNSGRILAANIGSFGFGARVLILSTVIVASVFSNEAQSQSLKDGRERTPTITSDQQSLSKAEKTNTTQGASTEETEQLEPQPPSQGTLADEAPNIVPVRPSAEPSSSVKSSAPQGTLADEAPNIIPLAPPKDVEPSVPERQLFH